MRAFKRGVRNLYRNGPRAIVLILILGVATGFFATTWRANLQVTQELESLIAGFENQVEVRKAGATEMGAGAELLPEAEVDARLQGLPHVTKVEKYILLREVQPEYEPPVSIVVGVRPGDAERLATHGAVGRPRIIAGRSLEPEDAGQNVAVVGALYAKSRNVLDVEKAISSRSDNLGTVNIEGTDFRIIGLYESGFEFGDNQILVPYQSAQRAFGQEGKTTLVWITVDSTENVPAVKRELEKRFADVGVDVITGLSWVDQALRASREIQRSSRFSAILALLAAALIITLAMVLVTRERTVEIGTLKALGASNGHIARQFLAEAASLGVAGAAFGLLFFATVGPPLFSALFGIGQQPLMAMAENPASGTLNVLSFAPDLFTAAWVTAVVVALGMLGSLYPAYRAARMDPAAALRHR